MSNVENPQHYSKGRIEVAVAMDCLGEPWPWLGHALKYACRAPHKGNYVEDCKKAIWCVRHAFMQGPVTWPSTTKHRQESIENALLAGVSGEFPFLRVLIRNIVYAHPLACDAASQLEKSLETA